MTFAADLSQFAERTNSLMAMAVQKTVIDIGERLVMRSPVGDGTLWKSPPPPGYAGGRFRANWQYGYGRAPLGDLPAIDSSGMASNDRIRAGVSGSPAPGIHYIMNNLPYAEALENGHSTQAPGGMVALVVAEFDSIVDEAAQ